MYGILSRIYSSKNSYNFNSDNFSVSSRTTDLGGLSKIEYAKLDDGSEEILVIDSNKLFISDSNIVRFQNLDGDDTIDRIRIDEYTWRDTFRLKSLMTRELHYENNNDLFNKADKLLLEERARNSN